MQEGAIELMAGMLMSKTGRIGLVQVFCFLGSVAFLVPSPPVPLISGSWFGLASLFPASGSFSFLLFFSCANPADLVRIPGSQLAV